MLFSWGWTGFGQTGTANRGAGVEQGVESIEPVKFSAPNPSPRRASRWESPSEAGPPDYLISVAAGNFHSACVNSKGELWTWGNARHGECGHLDEESLSPTRRDANSPANEEEPLPKRLFIMQPGQLREAAAIKFELVCCGMYHTLALSQPGGGRITTVWAWGSNDRGQLGLGKYGSLSTTRPHHIAVLDMSRVFTLCAGDAFSVAVGGSKGDSKETMLFTWGDNSKGQLGRETGSEGSGRSGPYSNDLMDRFVGHVKLPGDERLLVASVGQEVVEPGSEASKNGRGGGGGGNVSSADYANAGSGKGVEEEEVVSVACGAEHMLVLTRSGSVFAAGNNDEGQLGLGKVGDPQAIARERYTEETKRLQAAAAAAEESSGGTAGPPSSPVSGSVSSTVAGGVVGLLRRPGGVSSPLAGFGNPGGGHSRSGRSPFDGGGGDPATQFLWRIEHFLREGIAVSQVAAGGHSSGAIGHTFASSATALFGGRNGNGTKKSRALRGEVFTWGCNDDGQCGIGQANLARMVSASDAQLLS